MIRYPVPTLTTEDALARLLEMGILDARMIVGFQ